MKNVVTLVLGGGRGTRLFPLTKVRSKPAVPIVGKYRLIDVPLSNCINSGLNQIYVLTQFNSTSLHRHIRGSYQFDQFDRGFVEVLAAQQTFASNDWYQGTADAVRQNLQYLEDPAIKHVLILSGDQLYRMNYADMLATHVQSGADVTISAVPVPAEQAAGLGIMRLDETARVRGFLEKPETSEELDPFRTDPAWIERQGIDSRGRDFLASMGIYLFNRQTLIDVLEKTDYQDFGKEVFPASIRARHAQVHLFDGYWEDIGTIRSFYEANLSLAQPNPPFAFHAPDGPIYSRARFLPPTLVDGASIRHSLIADGCVIGEGTVIENSIIGLRGRIGRNVVVRNSIIMGNDHYENGYEKRCQEPFSPLGIGDGSHVEGAIVDLGCRIGRNVRIANDLGVDEADHDDLAMIRDRIVVIPKGTVLPDDWKLP